ncbi:hypothetical protein [Streptomyces thioluteus]|uniref:hypothetical protein n=1 Tax=Streptomyces thioluteus TaxID=66431 RepID=UPI0031EF345F
MLRADVTPEDLIAVAAMACRPMPHLPAGAGRGPRRPPTGRLPARPAPRGRPPAARRTAVTRGLRVVPRHGLGRAPRTAAQRPPVYRPRSSLRTATPAPTIAAAAATSRARAAAGPDAEAALRPG